MHDVYVKEIIANHKLWVAYNFFFKSEWFSKSFQALYDSKQLIWANNDFIMLCMASCCHVGADSEADTKNHLPIQELSSKRITMRLWIFTSHVSTIQVKISNFISLATVLYDLHRTDNVYLIGYR